MEKKNTAIDTAAVAELAKLSLSSEELYTFEKDMNAIVTFAKKVSAAAISENEVPLDLKESVMREDKEGKTLTKEQTASVFPSSSDGFVLVPKVVE